MKIATKWFRNSFMALDQLVNALFGWLLNLILRPKFRFGDSDETLSSVFGKNVQAGSCKFCGWICRLLNKIDPNHCAKSIERDEGRFTQ